MLKTHSGLLAVATITVLTLGGSAAFAKDSSATEDLSKSMCKDVMRLSGEERDLTLAFFHGYRLGKKNTTQFDTERLSQATDDFIDYCLDHPAEKALAAFEKFTK